MLEISNTQINKSKYLPPRQGNRTTHLNNLISWLHGWLRLFLSPFMRLWRHTLKCGNPFIQLTHLFLDLEMKISWHQRYPIISPRRNKTNQEFVLSNFIKSTLYEFIICGVWYKFAWICVFSYNHSTWSSDSMKKLIDDPFYWNMGGVVLT